MARLPQNMKLNFKFPLIAVALLILAAVIPTHADDASLPRYNALIDKINQDLAAGKHTQAELADDLRQLDGLLADEKGRRTDLAATILLQKGVIYSDVLDDPDQAEAIFQEIKTNYPGTEPAKDIDDRLMAAEQQSQIKKIRTALAPGTHFPDFSVTNTAGQPLSVAQYQGKVVLLDFWATWCPLCVAAIPEVTATYAQYHSQGFEIIGVSLDDDQDKFLNYTKENKMPWVQYFDGQHWQNKLAVKYGIDALPANLLIDARGNILAWNLTGEALPQAVARALAR